MSDRAERFKAAAWIMDIRPGPLAQLLGCGANYVSRVINGKQEPGEPLTRLIELLALDDAPRVLSYMKVTSRAELIRSWESGGAVRIESYRNTREGRLGFACDYLSCTGRRHSQPTGFLDSDLQSAAARTDDEAAHAWADLFRSADDESPAAVTDWDAAMLQLFGSG